MAIAPKPGIYEGTRIPDPIPTVLQLDERLRVTPSAPLMADLKALLGPSCLVS